MAANGTGPSPSLNLTGAPTAPSINPTQHPLPPKPTNFAAKADSMGLGGPKSQEAIQNTTTATQALAGSNRDVVLNRRAIRLANLSAAETLKAEIASLVPLKPSASSTKVAPAPALAPTPTPPVPLTQTDGPSEDVDEIPGLSVPEELLSAEPAPIAEDPAPNIADAPEESAEDDTMKVDEAEALLHGIKRKIETVEEEDSDEGVGSEEEAPAGTEAATSYALKVNPDGTVEQEDTVK